MNWRQERIRWCMGYARKDVEKTKKIAKKYKMTVTEVVLQGLEKVLNRPE